VKHSYGLSKRNKELTTGNKVRLCNFFKRRLSSLLETLFIFLQNEAKASLNISLISSESLKLVSETDVKSHTSCFLISTRGSSKKRGYTTNSHGLHIVGYL